jgi:5'-nucleotidase
MRILLTNDDGIYAPGLRALRKELLPLGEVTVVAPATEQSAAGHSVTLLNPLLVSEVFDDVNGEKQFLGWAVEGRPADCVKLALLELLPDRPDVIVSGMNAGSNAGINVLYSGTVAAAIEAAFLGLPAIATSLYLRNDKPIDYARSCHFARRAIEQILAAGLKGGQVCSVNVPPLDPDEQPTGIKVVRQCTRAWVDTYEERKDPRGRSYFWNSSIFRLGETENDTDVAALRDGYVTVTPLQFDLTHYQQLHEWEGREWKA